MTEIAGHHEDDCLMCAVRALTEGRAKEWWPEDPAEVTGVVLRQGTQPTHYSGPTLFVELWLGGRERVRVAGHSSMLRSLIEGSEIQVGDTVTVRYLGKKPIKSGRPEPSRSTMPREYKAFELEVQRGHR
jgi:hypothetical protein